MRLRDKRRVSGRALDDVPGRMKGGIYMEQYTVTGMSCAACSARVEKAVSKLDGVTSCSVSLLTNSMGVEGEVPAEKVIEAVEAAGYGASKKSADRAKKAPAGWMKGS